MRGLVHFGEAAVQSDGLNLLEVGACDVTELVADRFNCDVVYVHSADDVFPG